MAQEFNLPTVVGIVGFFAIWIGLIANLTWLWSVGIVFLIVGCFWSLIVCTRQGTPDVVILGKDGKPRSTLPEEPQFTNLRY